MAKAPFVSEVCKDTLQRELAFGQGNRTFFWKILSRSTNELLARVLLEGDLSNELLATVLRQAGDDDFD
jgi:hypothetical protein